MPPKQTFSKETIIETAFAILREEGWKALTARSIAKRLNASTMPVYSYIKSMEELVSVLRQKAALAMAVYQARCFTDNALLNMAVGYVLFAQEEANLFWFLYFDQPQELDLKERDELQQFLESQDGVAIPLETLLGRITPADADEVTLKSWIFTHGLAVALHHGLIPKLTLEEIVNLLQSAGGAFVSWKQQTSHTSNEKENESTC